MIIDGIPGYGIPSKVQAENVSADAKRRFKEKPYQLKVMEEEQSKKGCVRNNKN